MSKELVEKIKNQEWHADWSGYIPLIDICMAPGIYTFGMQALFGYGLESVLVTFKNGIAAGKFAELEYEKLGEIIASKMSQKEFAINFIKEFKLLADEVFAKIQVDSETFLNNFDKMKLLYANYGAHAEATKIAFNFLDDDQEEIKKMLAEARKYSENFYSQNAKAYQRLAFEIASKTGVEAKYILMMTSNELDDYTKTHQLPKSDVLAARYQNSGVIWINGQIFFLTSEEVEVIEESWKQQHDGKKLSGTCAYPGQIQGKCKVILDFRGATLAKGDILVTGMTTPDFVPLMKNASAIVTDGGGMLCHAAIVARELKTPCIIGTKIATKVLKDGDFVEVDAKKGIVKIL